MDREESVQHFLDLIKKSRRGKFKVYIGMIAGVGKSYRMLQEAHDLIDSGVDVRIGYIETHGRAGTEAVLEGLPVIPRRKLFYKGKELEEMDLEAIIRIHPEIVIVDELAHTNVEGSLNEKRWQDVMTLLDEGINVISAVNIQHIESVNEEVQDIAGIEVRERIPDSVLQEADEVVNIDLTAEELITRLKAGKIYKAEKIQTALNNFFKTENILQLRELALKEVALRVEKKVENEVVMSIGLGVRHEKFMACISSQEKAPRRIIRKAARLATRYNTSFVGLYVEHGAYRSGQSASFAESFQTGDRVGGRSGSGAVERCIAEHCTGLQRETNIHCLYGIPFPPIARRCVRNIEISQIFK